MLAERGAAPAPVSRTHRSGRPRVTVRPNYVGPPRWLDGEGRTRAEACGIRRPKRPPSDPGSTVPRPKIAAVERRKATRPAQRARAPQGVGLEMTAPFGAPPPHLSGAQDEGAPGAFKQPGPGAAVSEKPQPKNPDGTGRVGNLTFTLAGAKRARGRRISGAYRCTGASDAADHSAVLPGAGRLRRRQCRSGRDRFDAGQRDATRIRRSPAPRKPPARRTTGGRRAASPARRSTPCAG